MAVLVILVEREMRIKNLALKEKNRESGAWPLNFLTESDAYR